MPLLLPGLLSQRQKWMSTQIRSRSAPQWCVPAGWSEGSRWRGAVDWPVLWQRFCDRRRLSLADAAHTSRHLPVTARQHGRWMPRRQGSAATLRTIRVVLCGSVLPSAWKVAPTPISGAQHAAGHAVRPSARHELPSRNRLFGKSLRAVSRFNHQNAQTPLLPLWVQGRTEHLSKDTFSGIAVRNLLFCTPLRTALAGAGSKPDHHGVLMLPEVCIAHIFCPPLNPVWEKGAGGMEL